MRAVAAIKKQHEKEIAAKERQRVADEKHRKNEMAMKDKEHLKELKKHKNEMAAKDKQHKKEQDAAAMVHGKAVVALNKH